MTRGKTLAWLQFLGTAHGVTVLNWERAAYARSVKTVTGSRAVQIGRPELDALSGSSIGHRILVTQRYAVSLMMTGASPLRRSPKLCPLRQNAPTSLYGLTDRTIPQVKRKRF